MSSVSKMRAKIYSFDHTVLEEAVKKIIQVTIRAGSRVIGPVPLKTKKKVVVLHRSMFVFAKSKRKLQRKTHKRLIDIKDVTAETVNGLSTLSLPAGVDINIETITEAV